MSPCLWAPHRRQTWEERAVQRGAGVGRGWGVLDRCVGLRAFPKLTHSRLPSLTLQEEGLREVVEGMLAFAQTLGLLVEMGWGGRHF